MFREHKDKESRSHSLTLVILLFYYFFQLFSKADCGLYSSPPTTYASKKQSGSVCWEGKNSPPPHERRQPSQPQASL
ncbi:hypothetical protein BDV41DRAFT_552981 [Aspergillus transmontanensis]|uniref:Uncharacterized protein n=1 Tax=Aspergillus transmontanensis TaxID=1034304 RepID=A0A5N6VIB4_9EURO|nr:hypothetical protein BDV41DRAFT_552981 [Aspergillus transmontanensis]